MKLSHLKALCEVVDKELHLSNAAGTLHRSQPALSRQIQQLEESLGTQLFERSRNRLIRLTPHGEYVLEVARRIVSDTRNLHHFAEDSKDQNNGKLTLATTHTHARYTLPKTIQRFMAQHSNVELTLLQGSPLQCCDMVASGQADMAVCAASHERQDVVQIPCYQMQRIVVTPPGHPLLKEPQLTIDSIGRYPLILYGEGYSGRSVVDSAFRNANLTPKVILRAIDADVSKTYVELGLGIAILASITFDPLRDTGLRCIPAHHLFSASPLGVVLRPHSYLRHFAFALIRLFAPHITQIQIQQALNRTRQNFDPPPVL